MKKIIITVIGKDRPGIIASISEILFRNDCNIENISQTILQTEFAGICIAAIPENIPIKQLEADFSNKISDKELNIYIKEVDGDTKQNAPENTEPFIITTIGPDKKGLVACMSRVIADAGVNIKNLKAVFQGGTNPERNIMIYEVEIPEPYDTQDFSRMLKEKAAELDLALTFQHKNIFDKVNRI
jgi:glycine cleavage system transcriptional repressor